MATLQELTKAKSPYEKIELSPERIEAAKPILR